MIDGKPQIRLDVRFGSYETPTREGAFSMGWKSRNHVSTIYHTPMPYAMFFSGGQAVHYSADFAARGYAGASHGCVNVRNLSGITWLYRPGSGRRQGHRVSLITPGEDQRAGLGDRDGVLRVGAPRAVAAAQRPPVGVRVDLVGVLQEPRLDGDHQTGAERQPAAAAVRCWGRAGRRAWSGRPRGRRTRC